MGWVCGWGKITMLTGKLGVLGVLDSRRKPVAPVRVLSQCLGRVLLRRLRINAHRPAFLLSCLCLGLFFLFKLFNGISWSVSYWCPWTTCTLASEAWVQWGLASVGGSYDSRCEWPPQLGTLARVFRVAAPLILSSLGGGLFLVLHLWVLAGWVISVTLSCLDWVVGESIWFIFWGLAGSGGWAGWVVVRFLFTNPWVVYYEIFWGLGRAVVMLLFAPLFVYTGVLDYYLWLWGCYRWLVEFMEPARRRD